MSDKLQALLDRSEVTDTVLRFFAAFDRFDWESVAALVADEITVSAPAAGLPPTPMPRDAFVDATRERNAGLIATMHGNSGHVVTVEGDRARVEGQLVTVHVGGTQPGEILKGYGFTDLELDRTSAGWIVRSLEIRIVAEEGDAAKVHALAAQRAADAAKN